MPSFNAVNYSLRPSKSIQRSLVFEAIKTLHASLGIRDACYVGFGSVWFTDFLSAHKTLKIADMVSIEADDVGYRRAVFNRPYRTVDVEHGMSFDRLPVILEREGMQARPWVLWLDYDKALNEERRDDLRWAIENLPPNSILLTTFAANGSPYGRPVNRADRLRDLLGASVPDDLTREKCADEELPLTLARYTQDWLASAAADVARPGGYLPCISVPYRDSTPMVTVGGILPAIGAVPACRGAIQDPDWMGRYDGLLEAPHLTVKEVSALQSLLPAAEDITRADVQGLGFDLEDSQISIFGKYYALYPSFGQIIA